jgi:hypothetical protein
MQRNLENALPEMDTLKDRDLQANDYLFQENIELSRETLDFSQETNRIAKEIIETHEPLRVMQAEKTAREEAEREEAGQLSFEDQSVS